MKKDYPIALQKCAILLKYDFDKTDTLFLQSKILLKLHQYDESLLAVNKCINSDTKNIEFLNLKTKIQIAKSEYKDAFKSNQQSIEINDKCSYS